VVVYPSCLLRLVEVYNRSDITLNGTLGQPYRVLWGLTVSLLALRLERPISNIFDKEEEKFILSNSVAVLVLLLGVEVFKLLLL